MILLGMVRIFINKKEINGERRQEAKKDLGSGHHRGKEDEFKRFRDDVSNPDLYPKDIDWSWLMSAQNFGQLDSSDQGRLATMIDNRPLRFVHEPVSCVAEVIDLAERRAALK